MEHWWIAWQLSKMKQKELLQEAARFRLLQNSARSLPVMVALRSNLGKLLINWGTFLIRHRSLTRVRDIQTE